MFGEFNEVGKPKTSLAKYSAEFNDFAVTKATTPNTVFVYIITVSEKVYGQTRVSIVLG